MFYNWGEQRTFVDGDTSVTVLPHVQKKPISHLVNISEYEIVARLILINTSGNRDRCLHLYYSLVDRFERQNYEKYREATANEQ